MEPVVFKDGPMTAAGRNFVYSSHKVPGIGRKSLQSEEDKKKRKVHNCKLYVVFINCVIGSIGTHKIAEET